MQYMQLPSKPIILQTKNYTHVKQQWVLLGLEEEDLVGELHITKTKIIMLVTLGK